MDELSGLYLIDGKGNCYGTIELVQKVTNGQLILYQDLNDKYKKLKLEQDEFDRYKQVAKIVSDRYKFINKKGINNLYHFSPVENTESILDNGLLSRIALDKEGLEYQITDYNRLDNELNKISVSISFPNYRMRYKVENEDQRLVIYDISPRILLCKLDTEFYHTNSASSIFYNVNKERYITNQALKKMYTPNGRNSELKPMYTTDPQAEVLVDSYIPKEYINSVVINEDRNEDVRKLCLEKGYKCYKDSSLYRPRKDWRDWC